MTEAKASMQAFLADTQNYLQVACNCLTVDMYARVKDEFTLYHLDYS